MVRLEIYTSREDYVSMLGSGVNITSIECSYVPWLWSAYELLGISIEQCLNDEPLIKYISINQRLRKERSVKKLIDLRDELGRVRHELRRGCSDELACLSNRIYEYPSAINKLYRYYLAQDSLDPIDLSKLSIALVRYNLLVPGLDVFNKLIRTLAPDELKYLTFLSLFNPTIWPTHVTLDTRLMPYLNWVVVYFDDHYLILIISLGRPYVISDLNVNINGGRVVLSNDYETREVAHDYIMTRIESRSGHGLLFVGNWSDHAIEYQLNFRVREGSIKSTFLEANIAQLIPSIVLPRDFVSIKYVI
jgi:hypothetical protein